MCFFQTIKKLVIVPVSLVMMVASVDAQDSVNSSPVRVWGDITTIYRTRDFNGGNTTADNWLNIGTVNASSYIWRPWFALVSGGVSLSFDETEVTDQEPAKTEYVTGRIQFDLFPTSRFPFRLYHSKNRNELDDDLFNREISNSETGIAQQYRSLNGKHHYRAEYKQRSRRDDDFESLEGKSLLFSGSNHFDRHALNTDIQFDSVDDLDENEQANSYSVTGRHSYDDQSNFSIENLVSTSSIENDFLDSSTDTETAQFSSFLSWQPENRNDINLTGSFRLADLAINQSENVNTPADDSLETESQTLNINQGLVYEYSDNLLFRETINANYSESENQDQFVGNESLGASYAPDRIDTDLGDYGWSAASTLNNQHGNVESRKSLNNNFSHSLTNDFSDENSYSLRTNLTESLQYDYQPEEVDRRALDHSFSITWSDSIQNDQSLIRFSISDSRSEEREERVFQLANLQYSGFFRLSRFSRLSGNITLQKTKQTVEDIESENTVTNGQLEFSRDRLFQVPRLVFRSKLSLSKQESDSERLISQLEDDSETDVSWENSLNYLIGRLEIRLNLDYLKSDDDYDRLFKIQITRSFGDL